MVSNSRHPEALEEVFVSKEYVVVGFFYSLRK